MDLAKLKEKGLRIWAHPAFPPFLLASIASFVRFSAVLQYLNSPFQHDAVIWLDSAYYLMRAQEMAAGDLLGNAPAFLSPGYCGFLAVLNSVFADSRAPTFMIQAAIGSVTCLGVYLLARNWLSRPLAFIAALMLALSPVHIYFSLVFMPTTWLVFLVVGFVLASQICLKTRALGPALLASITLGAATATKPNMILALPLFLAVLYKNDRAVQPTRSLLRPVLVLITVLALLAPLSISNAMTSGKFVPFTTTGGQNFLKGNGPWASGAHVSLTARNVDGYWLSDYLKHKVDPTRAVELDREHFVAAVDYILAQPLQTLNNWGHKAIRFIHHDPDLPLLDLMSEYVPLFKLPRIWFGVITTLGLVGLVLLFSAKGGNITMLVGTLVIQAISIIALFVVNRYRLPFIALMSVPAAYTLGEFKRLIQRKDKTKLAAVITGIIASIALVWLIPEKSKDQGRVRRAQIYLGDHHHRQGEYDLAVEHYRGALEYKMSSSLTDQISQKLAISLEQGDKRQPN